MINISIILALKSALGLLFMWLLVFLFWKDYCLDKFREEVFAIRDELFLFAADGNIEFDHKAYTILRNRFNLLLRYAHEFTFIRFVLAVAILSKVKNAETIAWEEALATLPAKTQAAVKEYQASFVLAFLKYVTLRSVLLYAVVLVGGTLAICKRAIDRYVLPKVAVGFEKLESEVSKEERSGALSTSTA